MHRGAAKGINSEFESGRADGVHVDDITQIVYIRQDEIVHARGCRRHGRSEWHAPDPRVATAQQFVGTLLDPSRHIGVGRAAVDRVVLEATVLGWVVRRRDHYAVGKMLL